ncbi:MAG: purine-nucleoside phosphorylase [Fimbriiglobus sp.]
MTPFDRFHTAVTAEPPRAAVVLGSGLGAAADPLAVSAEVAYADVPGLVPPTVHGHRGRMAVGAWAGTPVVVCFGRVHFYEGHPWDRVTALVRMLADFGATSLVLTNAAGGIHPDLEPGSLMVLNRHLKLLSPNGWRKIAAGATGDPVPQPYFPEFVTRIVEQEAAVGRPILAGTYAALTGPSYETPSEIRGLLAVGADAVGMSTAIEAAAAVVAGMRVAALSCITNRAAGLSDGPLSHGEVEETAQLAVGRVGELLGRFLATV